MHAVLGVSEVERLYRETRREGEAPEPGDKLRLGLWECCCVIRAAAHREERGVVFFVKGGCCVQLLGPSMVIASASFRRRLVYKESAGGECGEEEEEERGGTVHINNQSVNRAEVRTFGTRRILETTTSTDL